MSLLVHWIVLALALWVAANVVPGVGVSSWSALLIGAAVLGMVNTVVRPVMTILTLPITVLTLGLFYLVVNGAAFGLAAAVVPGFDVSGVAGGDSRGPGHRAGGMGRRRRAGAGVPPTLGGRPASPVATGALRRRAINR